MATYKIKGQRFIRKYTEENLSPNYAASIEAQEIVDKLCEVPWTQTSVERAQLSYHTDEIVDSERKLSGFDANVVIRDSLDAAMWCAEHSGGLHRAFANVAVYRYSLPDAAIGKKLTSLCAKVTSDPYNSEGVRLHVFTNATGEIPMNCKTLRGEDASGQLIEDGSTLKGVAPRTTRLVGKEDYWFPTIERSTLTPNNGLTLSKYLFLVVALESYSTVRGNWIEGSSYIENNVEITTATAITALDASTINDLSLVVGDGFEVVVDECLSMIPAGYPIGTRSHAIRSDAERIIEDDGSQFTQPLDASGSKAAQALHRLYAEFYSGAGATELSDGLKKPAGVMFKVWRKTESHVCADFDVPFDQDIIRIESSVLAVPFVTQTKAIPTKIMIDFDLLEMSSDAYISVYHTESFSPFVAADTLGDKNLYLGTKSRLTKIGTVTSSGRKVFNLKTTSNVGTIIFAAFLPPESIDIESSLEQGIIGNPVIPKITLI